MDHPENIRSWQKWQRNDPASSGFRATATPFIPRLPASVANPGSFYQPAPPITQSGPELPPSPYYPLESSTFLPPDTPAGSSFPSPNHMKPEEAIHQGKYLGESLRDNEQGGVSLSRERSATSPAREVSFDDLADEGAASGNSGRNRGISDLGPLPIRGFEQVMHSHRAKESIWDETWLEDSEQKWTEKSRRRSNITISPGTVSNSGYRERSDSQSTVTTEPSVREKMKQTLRDVANTPTRASGVVQLVDHNKKLQTCEQGSQASKLMHSWEPKIGTNTTERSQTLSLAEDQDPFGELPASSKEYRRTSVRRGSHVPRLEHVVEEDGSPVFTQKKVTFPTGDSRTDVGQNTRAENASRQSSDTSFTRGNPILPFITHNQHQNQRPVRHQNANTDETQPDSASQSMGMGRMPIVNPHTHTFSIDNLNYNQGYPDPGSTASRARAATTPISLSQPHDSATDVQRIHDVPDRQEGFENHGSLSPQLRERAYSLAPGHASDFWQQDIREITRFQALQSSIPATAYSALTSGISNGKDLISHANYASDNYITVQQPLLLAGPQENEPASFLYDQASRDPPQQLSSPIRGKENATQWGTPGPRHLHFNTTARPGLNRQDHQSSGDSDVYYGHFSPAAYIKSGYGQSDHRQHQASIINYGQGYYDAPQPPHNIGSQQHSLSGTGYERYPEMKNTPNGAAQLSHAATINSGPRLQVQDHRSEHIHPLYLGSPFPKTNQFRNTSELYYGSAHHAAPLQQTLQLTPGQSQYRDIGAQQALRTYSPMQQTLPFSGASSMQQHAYPTSGSIAHHNSHTPYGTRTLVQAPQLMQPVYEAGPAPAAQTVPYRAGTDTMYPMSTGRLSSRYLELTRNGRPTFEQASMHIPFIEQARHTRPAEWGVLRIANVPYSVTKQEILAFLGRNAKIITPDLGCAIHIIMERSTGKTMDCFVEFFSSNDALAAVNRFVRQKEEGRSGRIGDRHVEVEMSGQDSLMKELFPRAKNVVWHGADPAIFQSTEPFNSGFKGFLTNEEMVMTVKHAETPHRSPFSHKCLQRTYESMISVLAKYPWWAVDTYTIADRDLLYRATEHLVRALINQLVRGGNGSPHINEQLLTELVYAGLNASGFSETQRARLVRTADWIGDRIRISPLGSWWPFEVLGRKADFDEDVVEYFAACLREATTSSALVSLAQISISGASKEATSPFGNVKVPWPHNKEHMTFSAAAAVEWGVVEGLLRKALGGVSDSSGA